MRPHLFALLVLTLAWCTFASAASPLTASGIGAQSGEDTRGTSGSGQTPDADDSDCD